MFIDTSVHLKDDVQCTKNVYCFLISYSYRDNCIPGKQGSTACAVMDVVWP